jgi:uncharacterized protein YigE (DUF2233 family)
MRLHAVAILWVALAAQAWAKGACDMKAFEGDRFTVCAYDPNTDKIAIAWRSAAGARLLGFPGLKAMLGAKASAVKFAVNAGMFHESGAPVGLFVSGGVRETALNRNPGPGNFHMLPNGVFWIGAQGNAAVETSSRFARRKANPVLATQSGPMLLIAGNLHPRIQDDGPSRLVRNGVGATSDGRAVFVLSEGAVSFGKLARFFRDDLGVRDALYLDGSVSSLWDPALNRMDIRAPLGPIIWVY